jgi:hypothetical protein
MKKAGIFPGLFFIYNITSFVKIIHLLMKQFSLVAFYGSKPPELNYILNECARIIFTSGLETCISFYDTDQMHATLTGLEKLEGEQECINRNLYLKTGLKKEMKPDRLAGILSGFLPKKIQFGGFNNKYRGFLSSGKTPYERSFHINRQTGKLVLMGWLHNDQSFETQVLNDLRNRFESECNIAHKYTNDNDLYIVIGDLNFKNHRSEKEEREGLQLIEKLETKMRNFLVRNPHHIELSTKNVSFVEYDDIRLPPDTTMIYPFIRSYGQITGRLKNSEN